MTLVELYDTIVGHEPELELNSSSPDLLEKLRKGVLEWIKRKSPGLQERGLDEGIGEGWGRGRGGACAA